MQIRQCLSIYLNCKIVFCFCNAYCHNLTILTVSPFENNTIVCVFVQELKSFKSFVNQRPPFDIVVDGLNVANTTPKATHS